MRRDNTPMSIHAERYPFLSRIDQPSDLRKLAETDLPVVAQELRQYLIEEVARLYGYDKLPQDIAVPLCTSAKSLRERVVERIGETLTAAGYFEAITSSFTSDAERKWFQPLGDQPALMVEHSSRRAENQLRQIYTASYTTTFCQRCLQLSIKARCVG